MLYLNDTREAATRGDQDGLFNAGLQRRQLDICVEAKHGGKFINVEMIISQLYFGCCCRSKPRQPGQSLRNFPLLYCHTCYTASHYIRCFQRFKCCLLKEVLLTIHLAPCSCCRSRKRNILYMTFLLRCTTCIPLKGKHVLLKNATYRLSYW